MQKTVVLNVVGLTDDLIGPHTPNLARFRDEGGAAPIAAALPAVTLSAQTTYLTGKPPREHGVVGNGWFFRDRNEVSFWHQSDGLVEAPRIWEVARERDPDFTCANLFWWFAMHSRADITLTPRPMYPADGRKLPDVWSDPPELRHRLQDELGTFPLFEFWGPGASIASSRWIAEAAKRVELADDPTLSLIYLPHLDYALQKYGPDAPEIAAELRAIDEVAGELLDLYAARGARRIVLSEYGIVPVSRPVHLNRALREAGLIATRDELGRELLDAGRCEAFAVADHQVAHVYVRDPARSSEVRALLEGIEGVAEVLDDEGKRAIGLDHDRAGDLVVMAEPDAWFTYYYWLDDDRAPDFARCVDIHRKPGFDPVELFLDPELRTPRLRIGARLLQKKLGFRYLMDVIPLDASLVRGSHGVRTPTDASGPLVMTDRPDLLPRARLDAPEVFDLILAHLEADAPARVAAE